MDLEKFLNSKFGKDITEEEFAKLISESVSQGKIPQITFVDDPDSSTSKAMTDYINSHHLLPKDYEKISIEEIARMGRLLLSRKTKLGRKKKILMILGHHGSKVALAVLERYGKNPDGELRVWSKMAINECKVFMDQKTKPTMGEDITEKQVQIKVRYDSVLHEITGKKEEVILVEQGAPFILILGIILKSYPVIGKKYPPGVLGFTLNGAPPEADTILREGDRLEFLVRDFGTVSQ